MLVISLLVVLLQSSFRRVQLESPFWTTLLTFLKFLSPVRNLSVRRRSVRVFLVLSEPH